MYCIDELKLNSYKPVSIPSNEKLFGRFGEVKTSLSSSDSDEVIPMNQNTLEQLEYMDKYDSYMQSVEQSSNGSESEPQNSDKSDEVPEES